MLNKFLLGILVALLAAPLSAQQGSEEQSSIEASDRDRDRQYVTDQLRLSLYANPDAQSQVLKLLQSGDLLEIEEISGPYALVTAPGGTRGWVKRGFLVTKPTSNLLLREEQEKTEALEAEIEKLSNSKVIIDQYEKDMDKLVDKIDELETSNQQANETITALRGEVDEKQRELERKLQDTAPPAHEALRDTFLLYWQFIVPLIILIVVLTFLVSKAIVEARIKSKFHGIKVW